MPTLKQHQERLKSEYSKFKSWQEYAESIGVKNGTTIWDYAKNGEVPPNKDDRIKMGIYELSKGGSAYRRRNVFAKKAGWGNLNKFLDAVENGTAEIPQKK